MLEDDAKPAVGSEGKMLGVRTPPNENADVTPDDDGNVHPRAGGMSVNRDWRRMWKHLIPRRLKTNALPATGSNRLRVWQHGEGTFEDGPITKDLALRADGRDHGLVEPSDTMAVKAFQDALAETRDDWSIIPEDRRV